MNETVHEHKLPAGLIVDKGNETSTKSPSATQQLKCFLAYADEVDLDEDTLQDMLTTELDDDWEASSDGSEPEQLDVSSLYSSIESENQPWTKQEVRFMLQHLKQKGMGSFIREYVITRGLPIPKLLLAFGIELAPPLQDKKLTTLLYFLKVALTRELHLRERLTEYNTLEDAVELIRRSRRIVILTGAGISVSCGIPDFRSQNGIYASLSQTADYELDDPQQMFDIQFFRENPRARLQGAGISYLDLLFFIMPSSKIYPSNFTPSPCHRFLKAVEDQDKNYTQNIDTLEHAAGVKRVLNCHGSFATAKCLQCQRQVLGTEIEKEIMSQTVPLCKHCPPTVAPPKRFKKGKKFSDSDDEEEPDVPEFPPSVMKPDITFFGEKLSDDFDKAFEEDREQVDLLLVIGTSLKVAPVADMLIHLPHSVPQILINKTPVRHINPDIILLGNADDIVQHLSSLLGWELPLAGTQEASSSENPSPRKRSPSQDSSPPVRVGDSHVWLFNGAEGGKWLENVRSQLGLPAEEYTDPSKADDDYRANKKAKLT